MKIAISAKGKDIEAELDDHFGRCPYFLFIDPDTMQYETLDNAGLTAPSGAGIAAAQFVAGQGVEIVLTGVCGPNASQALSGAGVKVITGLSGKISDIIARYKAGVFK
jgi:predicted Fe-Mo cluster-binding NifX family protein